MPSPLPLSRLPQGAGEAAARCSGDEVPRAAIAAALEVGPVHMARADGAPKQSQASPWVQGRAQTHRAVAHGFNAERAAIIPFHPSARLPTRLPASCLSSLAPLSPSS